MNTLRKKLTAIGLAGTVGLGMLATSPVQVSAAPLAPNQNAVKQSAPSQNEQVRHRGRWIAPAIALGVIGAVAGAHYYNRNYYYGPGPYYYGPRYRAYYGPTYYSPGPYYYGW